MVCPCVLVLLGTLGLWASQVSWASMSFQDTWAYWASSMLKAFLKAFNIEEAQEAHLSWQDIEAQETWEAQRPKRPKRPRHHQLMEGLQSNAFSSIWMFLSTLLKWLCWITKLVKWRHFLTGWRGRTGHFGSASINFVKGSKEVENQKHALINQFLGIFQKMHS